MQGTWLLTLQSTAGAAAHQPEFYAQLVYVND
jgi:hypothetical protein